MTLPNNEVELYQFLSDGNCAGLLAPNLYDSNRNLFTASGTRNPIPKITFPAAGTASLLFRAKFDRPVDRFSIYLVRTVVEGAAPKLNPVSFIIGTGMSCIEEPVSAAFFVAPTSVTDAGMVCTVSGPQLFDSVAIAGNVPAALAVPITYQLRMMADRIGACCTITLTKGQYLVP